MICGLADALSYSAWWHLWPVLLLWGVVGALAGWWWACHPTAGPGHAPVTSAVVTLALVWPVVGAGLVAATALDRRTAFDADLRAANSPAVRPVAWQPVSVGDIHDLGVDDSNHFLEAAARWLGLRPDEIVIAPPR